MARFENSGRLHSALRETWPPSRLAIWPPVRSASWPPGRMPLNGHSRAYGRLAWQPGHLAAWPLRQDGPWPPRQENARPPARHLSTHITWKLGHLATNALATSACAWQADLPLCRQAMKPTNNEPPGTHPPRAPSRTHLAKIPLARNCFSSAKARYTSRILRRAAMSVVSLYAPCLAPRAIKSGQHFIFVGATFARTVATSTSACMAADP